MDIRLNDILVMKRPIPAGKSGGKSCVPAQTSASNAWAAAMRS